MVIVGLTNWAKLTYSTIGPVGPVPRLKISHVSTLTFTTNGVSVGKKISALSPQLSLTSAPLFLRPPWPKAPNLQWIQTGALFVAVVAKERESSERETELGVRVTVREKEGLRSG